MSAGSRGGIAVSILILFVSGIPMTTEAGDAGNSLVVETRLGDSAMGDDSIRTTTASQAATLSTQPAPPECDGQAPPAMALSTFLNRVMGRERPEDVRLCAPPSDNDTATGHQE
ncbi:MAG: hypothetical protein ABI618_05670 [Nitrospirota bacterium]